MIRIIPLYVKGPEYSRFGPYGYYYMNNERALLGEIRPPIAPPSIFKQPVTNARGFHSADGNVVLVADQEHHFDEFMLFKAVTLKEFIDFIQYSSQYPTASLILAIPMLDRILQTSLKQLLFYFYELGIGYVNGTPESVLLFRTLDSMQRPTTQCSMAFADFEASFIISKEDPPMTKENCAVVNGRLPDHNEWIPRVVCYSLLSSCDLPEASLTTGEPDQPYDPIAPALFLEGQKWYQVLRFTPYSRLREPLHYSEYRSYTAPAVNEDAFFPNDHTDERYFYRYLLETSPWRAHSQLDRLAFSKMAATLVYLLHEDPAKRRFAIGIWCGQLENLRQWIAEPWEEPLNAPRTFHLCLYNLWRKMDDVDAFTRGEVNVSWLHHHYGQAAPGAEMAGLLRRQSQALRDHLESEEQYHSNPDDDQILEELLLNIEDVGMFLPGIE